MFWKKKPTTSPNDEIRDTLFGDLPIDRWANENINAEPWLSFSQAKHLIRSNQRQAAIEVLTKITEMEGLESRHYAQAYHFLKELGHGKEETPKKLLGVVVEVGMGQNAYDLLAAYPDMTARYYNYTGAGVIWEHPDHSLDEDTNRVLALGKEVMDRIGPWDQARPPAVTEGMVRLNMLTSHGLHFGQAPLKAMEVDPLGGGLLQAAAVLMQGLMGKTKR